MMYSIWKTSAYLLVLRLIYAKDLSGATNYKVQDTDRCPDEGSYFQRYATPNAVGPGLCYHCFCQSQTATCWQLKSNQCDGQLDLRFDASSTLGSKKMSWKLNRTIGSKRVRRSLSLFDRDSIKKHSEPQNQCTPQRASFSDGCPPDDWCIGCTVCECNAEGQWDCHILSFCNEEERKTRVNSQNILPKIPSKRVYQPNNSTPKNKVKPNNLTKKVIKKPIAKHHSKKTQYIYNKKHYNNVQKPRSYRSKGRPKPVPKRKNAIKLPLKKRQTGKKLKEKKNGTMEKQKNIKDSNKILSKKKLHNETNRFHSLDRNNYKLEESILGQKIVNKVMSTVQKMIEKQIEKRPSTKRSVVKNKKNMMKDKKQHERSSVGWNSNTPERILRKKRDALDKDLSDIELKEPNLADDNSTKNNITLLYSTTERTRATNQLFVLNSTKDIYYKYTIDTTNTSHFSTESATTINLTDKTSMLLETEVSKQSKNINGQNSEKTKQNTVMNNTEFDYRKYKNWERMLILRDSNSKLNKETVNYNTDTVKINTLYIKNNINSTDIANQLSVRNKQKIRQIITNDFKTESSKSFDRTSTPTNNSHNSLQILLQNFMTQLNKSKTIQTKLKTKYSLFKYLRNIFRKMFTKKKAPLRSHKTNEVMTLEVLCNNIDACYMNKHNRIALRPKIHRLNIATANIFKTINNIKGLLYLIEIPITNKNTTKKHLTDDIRKLNAILKDSYGNSSLTKMQVAQIINVKKNIKHFIVSVGSFASILNDIIDILYKNNKKYSCQRNIRFSHNKKKMNLLNKIKKLLAKYNIVQNTFMKQMYKLLSNIDKNRKAKDPKPKSDRALNITQIIDRSSQKIIENLRKLKNLAQVLSFPGRKKRQTMREDDAMEYLLMLMEYLLKQNHPLDTAPVNDGVDLLIEAIQNAPDIKPIKKKLLYNLPTTPTPTQTISTTQIPNFEVVKEDVSDSGTTLSKEENYFFDKNITNLAIEVTEAEEGITENIYFRKYYKFDNTTVNNELNAADTTEYAGNDTWEKTERDNTEKTGFDKLEADIQDLQKYEVFSSAIEDEDITPVNKTETPDIKPVISVEESTFGSLQYDKIDDEPINNTKPKLDWIEETFSKEIKEYSNDISIISETTSTPHVDITTIKPVEQSDISSITVELVEENAKKTKLAADKVMYRKQLEFLNSLDYGTEKTDFDDSEKEDEKFTDDGYPYPVYFV